MDFFSCLAENFDIPVLDWIAANLRTGIGDRLMPLVTALGDGGTVWIALAVALLMTRKYRKTGLAMGVAMVMGLLVCNAIMKPLFARPRPFEYQLDHFGVLVELLVTPPHDYSFPSGHTIASFEAAVVLFLYNKKWGIGALALACLIAFSRLYLYVHYPTDVLFSILLGAGIALIAAKLVNRFVTVKKTNQL